MKTKQYALVLSLFCLAAQAASFDCGSTGAYGPMNITTNTTLSLPPDGIFNCTTITVAPGATLSFTNNALNTPVYLLANGDVAIEGTIDVSGNGPYSIRPFNGSRPNKAGPGGFDGGYGGLNLGPLTTGGDGCGPGGGKRAGPGTAVAGAFASEGVGHGMANNTNLYGNIFLSPLIGGSGGAGMDGAPGPAGGGGGGAILIAANTQIVINGVIAAKGGDYSQYGGTSLAGSGGGIRVVAPVVTGCGSIDASGGGTYTSYGTYWGGLGRVRIDCQDNQAYRSLTLFGVASRGSRMIIFPTNAPQLDIIEVAGNPIPEGTNNCVLFELSVGAPTNQTVKVQARDFTNDVPICVAVIPENGSSVRYDAVVLQASGNPPYTNVPVVIPAGTACQIQAWTR